MSQHHENMGQQVEKLDLCTMHLLHSKLPRPRHAIQFFPPFPPWALSTKDKIHSRKKCCKEALLWAMGDFHCEMARGRALLCRWGSRWLS